MDELETLTRSWERSLRAANLSDATIRGYLASLAALRKYLALVGHSGDIRLVDRAVIESYMGYLRDERKVKSGTLKTRYTQTRPFFRWLVEEGEIDANPMLHIRVPKIEDTEPEVATAAMVTKLLKACTGNDFFARRDSAIFLVLIDTGMRAGTLMRILLEDLNLDEGVILVHHKGRKTRSVPIGRKSTAALDRYLRARARHPRADDPHLWIGREGAMHYHGIHDALNRRAAQAGLPRIHQHMFRHGFAHAWLSAGGNEGDLMQLGGWDDYGSMTKYARLTKQQRARDAHRDLSPGDRL